MTTKNVDQLIIKDLRVQMFAGIYDFEKQKPQEVLFNLIIDVETNHGRILKDIDDVVSYENIVNEIEEIISDMHYDLLEELAEVIAKYCLSLDRVICVDLCIEKTAIIPQTQSVGVRIVRCYEPN